MRFGGRGDRTQSVLPTPIGVRLTFFAAGLPLAWRKRLVELPLLPFSWGIAGASEADRMGIAWASFRSAK